MHYGVEAKVGPDGSIVLLDLPFHEGEKVEIVVKSSEKKEDEGKGYPLRGMPVTYVNPFDIIGN